ELRAVPAEDETVVIRVVDVTGNRDDVEFLLGHQPDVDAPVVIAVYQHDVIVRDAFDRRHHVLEKRTSAGRFSASTTPSTSASIALMTLAVFRIASSLTCSTVRSTQPIQSFRPSATTWIGPLRGRLTR